VDDENTAAGRLRTDHCLNELRYSGSISLLCNYLMARCDVAAVDVTYCRRVFPLRFRSGPSGGVSTRVVCPVRRKTDVPVIFCGFGPPVSPFCLNPAGLGAPIFCLVPPPKWEALTNEGKAPSKHPSILDFLASFDPEKKGSKFLSRAYRS